MVPLSMTLIDPDQDFKVAISIDIDISTHLINDRDIAIFTIERQ